MTSIAEPMQTIPRAQRLEPTFGSATTGKVGMWIFLVTDAMSFGGLLVAYAILRAGSTGWPIPASKLNIPLTGLNTFVLICSSVTMVLGYAAAHEGKARVAAGWLGATVAGGVLFLGGQAYEYAHLIHEGFTLSAGNFPATFYVITSFHGAHVFSGVTYLIIMTWGVLHGRFLDNGANKIEILGLFWHFVDLIWILVFTFVYLI